MAEIAIPAIISAAGGVAASKLLAPDTSAQQNQIAQAKQDQQIALARQQQQQQVETNLQDQQAGAISRTPRGRRLLQAATGDAGVASTLGGGS